MGGGVQPRSSVFSPDGGPFSLHAQTAFLKAMIQVQKIP